MLFPISGIFWGSIPEVTYPNPYVVLHCVAWRLRGAEFWGLPSKTMETAKIIITKMSVE